MTTMKVREAEGKHVPNTRGQAHLMGHNPQQWQAPTYNLLQKQLETKLAADGMPMLRANMLQEYQLQQQQQQQQQQPLETGSQDTSFHSCTSNSGGDTDTASSHQIG